MDRHEEQSIIGKDHPSHAPFWRSRISNQDILPLLFLLSLVGLFAFWTTRNKANTADELVHVLSGHAAWAEKDYRLNPENGILPSRISALPLQFMGTKMNLDTDSLEWNQSDQWRLGHAFWFDSEINHSKILLWSHVSMLLFNLTGILLVFLWSGQLWGRGGAYLSLLLAGFSPNFLGHMPLATSDFSGAWTLVLATLTYARMLEKLTLWRIALAGITAALAMLCKHTGILLAPVGICLLAWRTFDKRDVFIQVRSTIFCRERWVHKLVAMGFASLAAMLVCCFFIWLIYGFRYEAANPEAGTFSSFMIGWEQLSPTVFSPVILVMKAWHLIPEAFLYGLHFILSIATRGAFLNGTFSPDGFFAYHFWTFLYKTPLPAMIIHLTGISCIVAFIIRRKLPEIPYILRGLLVLGIVYGGMLLSSDISIGHRHAFPLLYLSCILSGICGTLVIGNTRWLPAVAYLLAFSMIPLSAINLDRAISYMNPIGGGSASGYKHLIDSSLDWGQDLPSAVEAIAEYKEEHPDRETYMAYFGTADPYAFGLKNTKLLFAWGVWHLIERPDFIPQLKPGLYVISASEMRSTPADWGLKMEVRYQSLRNQSTDLYQKLKDNTALSFHQATSILSSDEYKNLNDYEIFRAQRLKMYLTKLEPDDILHGSILLFDLNAEQLMEFGDDPTVNQ